MAEDEEVYAWKRLMVEAGVSPRLRHLHDVLWTVLLLLFVAAVALIVVGIVVGIFFDGTLLYIGFALFGTAFVLMLAASAHRWHLIREVRWAEGTVTFLTVEPGGLSEDGQYVECRVRLNPPSDITRVATQVGPLDAERLAVGGTMRCLIDRNDGFKPLRVFPYAAPDAPLPSGRVLKFQTLKSS